jgi:hypothetical protein
MGFQRTPQTKGEKEEDPLSGVLRYIHTCGKDSGRRKTIATLKNDNNNNTESKQKP